MPDLTLVDPAELDIHPLARHLHMMPETSPDWREFKRDIAENGILDPIHLVVADGKNGAARRLVVDGRNRLKAARELQLTQIPAQIHPETDAIRIIIGANKHRKHFATKGALAYEFVPLLKDFVTDANERRLANLKKGKAAGTPLSEKKLDAIAREIGLSEDVLRQAIRVREIFSEDDDYRREMEPAIFGTYDDDGESVRAKGLGAIIAGYAGRKATAGVTPVARKAVDLFEDYVAAVTARLPKLWLKVKPKQRAKLGEDIQAMVGAWPEDLRGEVKLALQKMEEEGAK